MSLFYHDQREPEAQEYSWTTVCNKGLQFLAYFRRNIYAIGFSIQKCDFTEMPEIVFPYCKM